jgi:hypothetical protein
VGVSAQMWHWYSGDQALAASHFARRAAEIEAEPTTPNEDELARNRVISEIGEFEYRSCVIASVSASVAFLEATANEVVASVEYDNLNVGGDLSVEKRRQLAGLRDSVEDARTLDAFQIVLAATGNAVFDRGAQPYQDAAAIVRLRNELVHYKPKWREAATPNAGMNETIAKQLNGKFKTNPFTGEGNSFFPDKCLSAGCAGWSWLSALALADEFFRRLGVGPPYDHLRVHLSL